METRKVDQVDEETKSRHHRAGVKLRHKIKSADEEKTRAIMSKAEKEISAYRAEWNRRLDAGELLGYSANGRILRPDGSVAWNYHDAVRAVADKECEVECDQMRYLAEQQCKFIK